MAETGFYWIYLIFFLIPLFKILPRLIKKWKLKKSGTIQQPFDNQFQISNNTISESSREIFRVQPQREPNPISTDMLVLGELNHGTKNFDVLQKKLGIDNETLTSILEDLENQGLMRVEQKQGLLGPKVELYSTEEGAKKYYS
ncbi:MAG: winged helix-turn-helix transcriptional regulator [Nitrosopumilaceae archaeon]